MAKATLSFEDIRELLRATLNMGRAQGVPSVWVQSVFADRVVYEDESQGAGALFERTYTIDAENKVTFGDPVRVIRRREYTPVKMSDGQWHKIFEAGSYPDKGIDFTNEEVATMAAVRELDVTIGHAPDASPLDGHLGKVEVKAGGLGELLGRWIQPAWLKPIIGSESPVSLEIDRKTKMPTVASLVLNPRVPDAKLVAAFAQTKEGKSALRIESPMDENTTGLMAGLKRLLKKHGAESDDDLGEDGKAAFSERERNELAKLRAERDQLNQASLTKEAVAFADAAVAANRVLPANRDQLVALFGAAAKADGGGDVKFSAGAVERGECVKALESFVASLKPHTLTQEQIKGGSVLPASFSADETPKVDRVSREDMAEIAALYGGGKGTK